LDGMRQKTKIKAQKPTILFDFVCLLLWMKNWLEPALRARYF
jgi:hypothetical protein